MNDYATVCAECLCASCWLGEFYCENAKVANVVVISRREAELLNRENLSWFDDPDIRASIGEFLERPTVLGARVVAECAEAQGREQ